MTIQTNNVAKDKLAIKGLTGPVAAWGFLQLAILGLGAGGVPLWAHHPLPRESIAFQEMLCGQILVLSMLFPVLIRWGWGLAINLVMLVPFEELSGLLSYTSQANIARGWGCIAIWMIGLAIWGWKLKDVRRQMWVVLGAMMFTFGGVMLDYVRWEAILAEGQGKFLYAIESAAADMRFRGFDHHSDVDRSGTAPDDRNRHGFSLHTAPQSWKSPPNLSESDQSRRW